MLKQYSQQFQALFCKQRKKNDGKYPSSAIKENKDIQRHQQHKLKKHTNTTQDLIKTTKHELSDQLWIYQWRSTTEYPIVFANCNYILLNKSMKIIRNSPNIIKQLGDGLNEDCIFMEIQTEMVTPIQQFQPLPFANFIYVLKQSLVAFQRLYNFFGSFQINPKMITINDKGKVKVWLSNDYCLNTKTNIEYGNIRQNEQELIINQIKSTFLNFTQQNSIFRQFFKHLYHITTFLDFFKFLEWFIASHKISIIKFIDKNRQTSKKRPLSPIINLKPITKAPRFLSPPRSAKGMQNPNIKSMPKLHFEVQQKLNEQCQSLYDQETKQTIFSRLDENLNLERQSSKQSFNDSNQTATNNLPNSIQTSIDRAFLKKIPAKHLQDLGRQVTSSFILPERPFNYI